MAQEDEPDLFPDANPTQPGRFEVDVKAQYFKGNLKSKEFRQTRWFRRLFLSVCAIAGLTMVWFSIKGIFAFHDWAESQSRHLLVFFALSESILLWAFIVLCLGIAFRKNPKWQQNDHAWLYALIFVALVSASDLYDLVFVPNNNTGYQIRHHPHWSAVTFQVDIAILLVGIGAFLYLFKRFQISYGLFEIVIGFSANMKVLRAMDLQRFQRLDINFDDIAKLAIFTYVISRGITNILEGNKKRVENSSQPNTATMDSPTP